MSGNKYRGEGTVRLDRVRKLKIDLNAMCSFECEIGKPVQEIFVGADGNLRAPGFTELRALLWCALLAEDPKLTVEDAGRLVEFADGHGFQDKIDNATAPIGELLVAQFSPDAKKNAEALSGEIESLPAARATG